MLLSRRLKLLGQCCSHGGGDLGIMQQLRGESFLLVGHLNTALMRVRRQLSQWHLLLKLLLKMLLLLLKLLLLLQSLMLLLREFYNATLFGAVNSVRVHQ